MSQIEMACTRLKDVLGNPSAIQRYITMHDIKYVHPGWVDYQKKCTSRVIKRRHTNENHI